MFSKQQYSNRKSGKLVHEFKVSLPWFSARFLFRFETDPK